MGIRSLLVASTLLWSAVAWAAPEAMPPTEGEWAKIQTGAVVTRNAPDLDPLGHLGERGKHRPALEVLPVELAVEGIEVVPVVDDVEADLLSLDSGTPQ